MSETPREEYEDENVEQSPEREKSNAEKLRAMEGFLAKLKEMATARKQHETVEGIPTEQNEDTARETREAQESKAEAAWERILNEGINQETLQGFLDNVMSFSARGLSEVIATIDNLIREWDPAVHKFLRDLKQQLQAIVRLKEEAGQQ